MPRGLSGNVITGVGFAKVSALLRGRMNILFKVLNDGDLSCADVRTAAADSPAAPKMNGISDAIRMSVPLVLMAGS